MLAQQTKTALETPYVSIRITGHRGQAIEIVWHNFAPSRELRPTFQKLLDHLRAQPLPTLWLCDHSAGKIIAPEDQGWLLDELRVLASARLSARERRLAIIQAVDLFGRLSVANLTKRLAERCQHLAIGVFDERAHAMTWLTQQEEKTK
jgi:hypothetical protein